MARSLNIRRKGRKRGRRRPFMNLSREWRHKRGRKWTMEQMDGVTRMIQRGFSIDEIYRATGASKVRQSKIWKRMMNKYQVPPNFPSQKSEPDRRRKKRVERIIKEEMERKGALEPFKAAPPTPYKAPDLPSRKKPVFAPPREIIEEEIKPGELVHLEAPVRRRIPRSRSSPLPFPPGEDE